MVVEVGTEDIRRDGDAAPVGVAEVEDPRVLLLVVVAVPDDVQDVHLVVAQPRRERGRRRRRQPVEMDLARRDPVGESVLEPAPLRLDVQLGEVGGRGEDDEDAQWPIDDERPRRLGHLEVAHHGGAFRLREVGVRTPVPEQLPRQARELRGVGELQADAQTLTGRPGRVEAARPGQQHLLPEEGVEQPATEVGRGLRPGVGAGAAHLGAAGVELEKEVLQGRRVERHREGGTGPHADRAGRDARAVRPVLQRLDEQVEVLVVAGRHGRSTLQGEGAPDAAELGVVALAPGVVAGHGVQLALPGAVGDRLADVEVHPELRAGLGRRDPQRRPRHRRLDEVAVVGGHDGRVESLDAVGAAHEGAPRREVDGADDRGVGEGGADEHVPVARLEGRVAVAGLGGAELEAHAVALEQLRGVTRVRLHEGGVRDVDDDVERVVVPGQGPGALEVGLRPEDDDVAVERLGAAGPVVHAAVDGQPGCEVGG